MYGWLELDRRHPTRAYPQAMCGLCASYGRGFRARTRLLASADPTLLVVLLEGLAEEAPARTRVRCPLTLKLTHRTAIAPDWPPLVAVAELQLVLAGEKLFDDRLDRESLFTRVAGALIHKDLGRAEARLADRGFPVAALRGALRRQAEVEADPRADLDAVAAPTAEGIGLVTSWLGALLALEPADRAALERFGQTLGRLLYLVDALADCASDVARGRYNPLVAAVGALTPRRRAWLAGHVAGRVAAHEAAFAALPLARHRETLHASLVARLAAAAADALTTRLGGPP